MANRHKNTVMKKVAEALCSTAMQSGEAADMETALSSITVLYQSGDAKASPVLPFASQSIDLTVILLENMVL